MLKNCFAAVGREQHVQIAMFYDDVRDVRIDKLNAVINGIRLGLLTSLLCQVSLRGMSEARSICLVTKLRL